MTTLREAAQQALEALCLDAGGDAQVQAEADAITALRAALEQPEQEPVAWMTPGQDLHLNNGEGFRFSDWTPLYTHPPRREPEQEPVVPPELEAHFRHLDAVLEQPEKEPVKRWPFVETPEQFSNRLFEAIREFSSILPAVRHVLIENPPMFTHPPRREWRLLSEEEIYPLYNEPRSDAEMVEFARAVEQALRSKNHE